MQQQTGAPTMIQYAEFNQAFDYLNSALFGGELPKVLVTFSRKPRMLGYYSPDRWERTNNPEDVAGEISFNPDTFGIEDSQGCSIHAGARNGSLLAVEIRSAQPSGIPQRPVGNQDGIHRVDAE